MLRHVIAKNEKEISGVSHIKNQVEAINNFSMMNLGGNINLRRNTRQLKKMNTMVIQKSNNQMKQKMIDTIDLDIDTKI